jgi:hypothetical protein
MKTLIPLACFNIQALFHAIADFSDAVCGEEFQAATLSTESEHDALYEQDWENLPRYEREQRFSELETKLKSGETLVLSISEPYVGEAIGFVDGSTVDVSEDEDFKCGETDCAILFLDLDSATSDLQIETGILCGDGCMRPPSLHRVSIGSLDKLVQEFLKRFIKS